MLLFVIFQDPLYMALEKERGIKPMVMLGKKVLEVGYADDTNIFTGDDCSFVAIFELLNKFERASNSKINIKKTKVYGFGRWNARVNWPIGGIKVELDYFSTLGITFSVDYNLALETMWNTVCIKIKKRIPLIVNRNFTLFQKAAISNCLLASKLWYISHIYPLPVKYAILFNQEIFYFIWGSRTNPIKRDTLYNNKYNGGIGLINIEMKCKSILVCDVIKRFLFSERHDIIRYYMYRRISHLFSMSLAPIKVSCVNTPYYENTVMTIKKCKDHKKFPNLKPKDVYELLVHPNRPNIESLYPNYDWANIWQNLNFRYMNVMSRNIMYKYLNDVLPNYKRLNQIRISDSPYCRYCDGSEDSNVHRFYFCGLVQESLNFMKRIIFYFSGVQANSLLSMLMLDIPKIEKKNKNCLIILISGYISSIWLHREDPENFKHIVKANVIKNQRFHMQLLGRKAISVFPDNYCNMDLRVINNM